MVGTSQSLIGLSITFDFGFSPNSNDARSVVSLRKQTCRAVLAFCAQDQSREIPRSPVDRLSIKPCWWDCASQMEGGFGKSAITRTRRCRLRASHWCWRVRETSGTLSCKATPRPRTLSCKFGRVCHRVYWYYSCRRGGVRSFSILEYNIKKWLTFVAITCIKTQLPMIVTRPLPSHQHGKI